jgi:hypothetical protein
LVRIRNCAWDKQKAAEAARAVWARNGVVSSHCPKSVITSESLYYLEQFRYWKQLGSEALNSMEAKTVDAVLLLEQAWRLEKQDGEI